MSHSMRWKSSNMTLFTDTHTVAMAVRARVHNLRHGGTGTTSLRPTTTKKGAETAAVFAPMRSAASAPRTPWGRKESIADA